MSEFSQPRNQDTSTPMSVPAAPVWVSLLRDACTKENGDPRHLPENVNTAILRLKQLVERDDIERDEAECAQLKLALQDYADILRNVERRSLTLPNEEPRYQLALFRYLDSQRLFADFHSFSEDTKSSNSFPALRDEVLNRDGFGFFFEMRASLREGEDHPLLSNFVDLVMGTVSSVDRELVGEGLKFMALLYALGRLKDMRFFMQAHARNDLTGLMLIPAAENLGHCNFLPSRNDGLILFGLGGETARLSPHNIVGLNHPMRSEPHVEFGYYAQRILDISHGAPSLDTHSELCKLVRIIPEYFVYLDGAALADTIRAIRRSVLAAIPQYQGTQGLQLANCASELIQLPWTSDISELWKACAPEGDARRGSAPALILRAALKNPLTARELQEELRKRDSLVDKGVQDQARNFGLTVASLIHSERFAADDNPVFERALRLLKNSPEATMSIIPELLEIVGIPSLSRGQLGAITLPWSTRPDPRPLIQSLARDLLYDVHNKLGPLARWRLGFL